MTNDSAYHSVFSMYGFWLPNDPRGSGSDYVASWELFRYGPATKTHTRRSVAGCPLPPNWQREARSALHYPPVVITGRQALAIGQGFATAIAEGPYRVYACAILPEHVHLLIGASDAASARSSAIFAAVQRTPSENSTCGTVGRCGENTVGTSTWSPSRRSSADPLRR